MGPHRTASQSARRRPFLITFSGIDGAGKTTQIENLAESLEKQGLRVKRLSFWDHVAAWSNFRAGVGGRVLEDDGANATGGRPPRPRNNKHVRKWYLTTARSGLYVLDVARLRRLLSRESIRDFDAVIFDRYIYDQIANIDSRSVVARMYVKMVLKQTPVPDLAFIIDTSPDVAFARKPEYPLEFVHSNRQSFLRLKEIAPQLIIIPEGEPDEVRSAIDSHIIQSRLFRATSEEMRRPTPDPVDSQLSCCSVRNEPTADV